MSVAVLILPRRRLVFLLVLVDNLLLDVTGYGFVMREFRAMESCASASGEDILPPTSQVELYVHWLIPCYATVDFDVVHGTYAARLFC